MPTISVDESAIQGLQRVMDHLLGGVSTLSASTQNSTSELDPSLVSLLEELESAVDTLWLLFATAIMFLVIAGYGLFEAGSIRKNNSQHIIMKNILIASGVAVFLWLLGYGLAFGEGSSVVGTNQFLLMNTTTSFSHFFFQFVLVSLLCIIISCSVTERLRFWTFLIYPPIYSILVYPFLAHWLLSASGFLSAFNLSPSLGSNGYIDLVGGGVIHVLAGISSFFLCWIVGPRYGRFQADQKSTEIPGHNLPMASLGVLLVWQSLVFQAAQTSNALSGQGTPLLVTLNVETAARGAINAIISSASAGGVCFLFTVLFPKKYDLPFLLQGVISGLVSASVGAGSFEIWAAFVTGVIGALLYFLGSSLMRRWQMDDAIDVVAVHGFSGAWGIISVGFFAKQSLLEKSMSRENLTSFGVVYGGGGEQLGMQVLGLLIILAWGALWSGLLFWMLHRCVGLRVANARELQEMPNRRHKEEPPRDLRSATLPGQQSTNRLLASVRFRNGVPISGGADDATSGAGVGVLGGEAPVPPQWPHALASTPSFHVNRERQQHHGPTLGEGLSPPLALPPTVTSRTLPRSQESTQY